jgi:ribose 1,5-bisphosphokinase PhnN
MIEVLVIAGPAGVGKTSVMHEVSARLRESEVAHAVVDTDALDDVFPAPEDQWRITERNLAFVWQGYRDDLGVRRLILTGVYLHRAAELAWIQRATGADHLMLVQLAASDATLRHRVSRREVGSAYSAQLTRTLTQARALDRETTPNQTVVHTDGRSVGEIATEVVAILGWA